MKIAKFDVSGFDARLSLYDAYAKIHTGRRYNVIVEEVAIMGNNLSVGDYGPMTDQEEREHDAQVVGC